MVITIDGPAGSGKSTVARRVAKCLATPHVDTGAMYRVVTLLSLEQDLSLDNAEVLGTLARSTQIEVRTDSDGENIVLVSGRDVTREIRSPEVSRNVSLVAAHREVREALTGQQRRLVSAAGGVLEGRDTGTVVCPDADVKIFLTASITERACRRRAQLIEQGVDATQASLEREMQARDTTDSERTEAPLLKAADATELDTTDMNEDEVIEEILRIVNEHQTRA